MSPTHMSKVETAIRTVLAFIEACNRHNVADMMQYLSDDCIFESATPAPDGTVYAGKKAITQFWQDFFHASPQAQIKIEEIFSAGYRCIMRWHTSWADESGNEAHLCGIDIFQVSNGLICQILSYLKG